MNALCLPETTGHSQHFGVLYESISQSEPEIQALKVNTVTASGMGDYSGIYNSYVTILH